MKKSITYIALVLVFYSFQLRAQDGYTYTLVHNGGYDFAVQAAPSSTTSSYVTSVQSYGFAIVLPDGVTATVNTSLGNNANATFFEGNDVGDASVDGYLITELLSEETFLTAPSSNTNTDVISFTINGNPTSGELKLLENNSSLSTSITALKSFMAADMIDDSMPLFPNVIATDATGVSGMNSFSFSALAIESNEALEVSIFPNPTTGVAAISSIDTIKNIEIYNISGQLVKTFSERIGISEIDITELNPGIYFVKIPEFSQKTYKLIKH